MRITRPSSPKKSRTKTENSNSVVVVHQRVVRDTVSGEPISSTFSRFTNSTTINSVDDQSLYTAGGDASEGACPLDEARANRRDTCRIGNARVVVQERIISLTITLI